MFERELMIMGLRKQLNHISDLLHQIERPVRDYEMEENMKQFMLLRVAQNLKKLRQIKRHYHASVKLRSLHGFYTNLN